MATFGIWRATKSGLLSISIGCNCCSESGPGSVPSPGLVGTTSLLLPLELWGIHAGESPSLKSKRINWRSKQTFVLQQDSLSVSSPRLHTACSDQEPVPGLLSGDRKAGPPSARSWPAHRGTTALPGVLRSPISPHQALTYVPRAGRQGGASPCKPRALGPSHACSSFLVTHP